MPWNNKSMLTDKDGNFIPQIWDPSINDFIPWDGKVQLSGTKVILRPVDAVAIADTVARNYKVDVGGISDITILAYSTLSEPVMVTVEGNVEVPLCVWDADTSTYQNVGAIVIPAHAGLVLVSSHPKLGFVKEYTALSFNLRVQCAKAPQYGSLTINVTGVRV